MSLQSEIILNNSIIAAGLASAPIPILDNLTVTGIQIKMIKELSTFYNREEDEDNINFVLKIVGGGLLQRLFFSAVKFVPGIGTLAGVLGSALLAFASTYALGNLYNFLYSNNYKLQELDAGTIKEIYNKYYEQGKASYKESNENIN